MSAIIRKYRFFLLALLAFVAELAMLTFWRNRFGHHASAIVFFSASLLSGMAILPLSFRPKNMELIGGPESRKRASSSKAKASLVLVVLVALLSILAYRQFHHLFLQNPVSVEQSDIVPQTKVLVQRVLQHQFPYQPISFGNYELFPTYQPLQWLPFTMAETMGADYRLFALCVLLLALTGFAVFVYRKKSTAVQLFFFILFAFLPLFVVAAFEPFIYTRTLETLIAAYYLFFCLALFSRSPVAMAAALVLCLLSRYSVVLWVPLFFFMMLVAGERKKSAIVLAICTLGVVLIYVLPFLSQDSRILLKGYQYHSQAALAEWQGQAWQQPGEKPFQLFRGIGFAGSFYSFYDGSTPEKLKAFQLLHFVNCAAMVLVLGILFYLKRKQVSLAIFALASLKIYLAVFYHFIQIPYDYLYLTPVYVSVPVLWVAATFGSEKAVSNGENKSF